MGTSVCKRDVAGILGALLLTGLLGVPGVLAPHAEELDYEQPPGPNAGYASYVLARGDMHVHTLNSDGATSIAQVATIAKTRNLSWVVITDHAGTPLPGQCEAETGPTFLCLKGQEITTNDGHVTAHGIQRNITTPSGGYTMGDAMEEAYQQGGLAFVAHPFAESANSAYLHFGTYDDYTGMEIYHGYAGWNDNPITSDMDLLTVQKWDEILNGGRRMVGIGASDSHDANNTWDQGDLLTRRGAVGYPRDVSYLQEFSQRGVLEALERGRVIVTDGPELEFTVADAIPGEELKVPVGTLLPVNLTGSANVSSTVRLIANGSVVYSQPVSAGPFSLSTSFTPTADSWVRAEVRSFNGNILKGETFLAFANPVYIDVPPDDTPPAAPTNLSAHLEGGDVVLTWDPSPSSDIDHYAVYRASGPSGFDFRFRTARPRLSMWRDVGATVDGSPYYYTVRAVDRMGHEEGNMALAAKMVFPVFPGPNLLSVPLAVENDSVSNVMQTVNFSGVRQFVASDSEPWFSFSYVKSENRLYSLPLGCAFWVNVNVSGEYVVAGPVLPAVSVLLKAGWNLVSYATHTSRTVASAFSGIAYSRAEVFQATSNPYRLRAAVSSETLTPGVGLWVYVDADATWTLTA